MGIYYYAAYSKESKSFHVEGTVCDPYVMGCDELMFDSPAECRNYWKLQGIEVA